MATAIDIGIAVVIAGVLSATPDSTLMRSTIDLVNCTDFARVLLAW
eukprot:CAMPEP_0206617972 /NCGR_PEP_ID=MMETSP0325_2-20121206/59945_1 /ASSEMBLY_ACC=CAM_ASM_000347 /TAXON_ID=2866 /ORGANISM="Crypthecodinium cohnii, Strain Seligo" /LENGTH=45 /DNA_ID= /DNA_START= /DNA_END= /DNA_ORIENTATION=